MLAIINKRYSYYEIIFVFLFLYVGMVYFSYALSNIFLGLAMLLMIFGVINKSIHLTFNKTKWITYFFIIVPFVLTFLSVLYSDNSSKGFKYLWLRLPILIIPFIILFYDEKIKTIKNGLTVFIFFTILAALKTVYNAFRYVNEDVILIPDFTFLITTIQHPYLGVFVLIAFVSIIEFELIKIKTIRISVFLLFTAVIILTTSRLVYALFVFLIIIYSLKYFSKIKTVLLIILLVIISSTLILSNTAIKNKFQTSYVYQNSPRLKLWNNSYKIMSNPNNTLFGIGIGDYYLENKDVYFFREDNKGTLGYNPHSQIIEFALTNGLFGILILGFALIMGFIAILKQNRFAKIVFGIIVMFSFTECILTRQYGVQLYSLFVPLLFSANFKKAI